MHKCFKVVFLILNLQVDRARHINKWYIARYTALHLLIFWPAKLNKEKIIQLFLALCLLTSRTFDFSVVVLIRPFVLSFELFKIFLCWVLSYGYQ